MLANEFYLHCRWRNAADVKFIVTLLQVYQFEPLPSASLIVSSPKFAHLSPVHSNSINDSKSLSAKSKTTNLNLLPAYTEDNRTGNAINTRVFAPQNALTDQRNERFISGGNLLLHFLLLLFLNVL